jgi:hypothetical protein
VLERNKKGLRTSCSLSREEKKKKKDEKGF